MLIPLGYLVKKYDTKIKGVIHVGAHECEELKAYNDCGIETRDVLWLEGQQHLCERMKRANPDLNIHQAVVAEADDKELDFIVTNNYQSSSILELEEHKRYCPWVVETGRYKVRTVTLDSFIREHKIDASRYNMINIDIQGAELLALKGAVGLLATIDYLYLEVNTAHLYKGCALMGEIDEFLKPFGFERVETIMTDAHWGDAFYVRTRPS